MRTDAETDEQTDGHEEANNRFSQFFERTKEGKAVVNGGQQLQLPGQKPGKRPTGICGFQGLLERSGQLLSSFWTNRLTVLGEM